MPNNWEGIIIGILAILPYVTIPHNMAIASLISVVGITAVVKYTHIRSIRRSKVSQEIRIFGTVMFALAVYSLAYALPNMAYTGTKESIISAAIAYAVIIYIAYTMEESAYRIAKTSAKILEDSYADNIYIYQVFPIGIGAIIIIGTGTISTLLLMKKASIALLLTAIRLLSSAMYIVGLAVGLTPAKYLAKVLTRIKGKNRQRITKWELALGGVVASIFGSAFYGYISSQMSKIAETMGIPLIIALVIVLHKYANTMDKNKRFEGFLRNLYTLLTLYGVATLLPVGYAILLPNSFDIDCTQNFEVVGENIFAYGPQEIIIYLPEGVPEVIAPWTPHYFDINTFCSSDFKIVTSLGKVDCDPKREICRKDN